MLGKIVYMSNNLVHIAIPEGTPVNQDLVNLDIIFEDNNRKILGEIEDISRDEIKVRFMGEIVGNRFLPGVIRKPSMSAKIRVITKEELSFIIGEQKAGNFYLGTSPLYDNYPIMGNINSILGNHMSILGNTGSGKSWGVARIIQNLFYSKNYFPVNSRILIIDAYGEYHNAFERLNEVNLKYNFKYYTTDTLDKAGETLKIPLWLLELEDIALLLQANSASQLMILEKVLKLAYIFAMGDEMGNRYKNHLIATAIMSILYTNQTASSKKNEVFELLENCKTLQFSLNSPVQGIGYVREFKDCFMINSDGSFSESVLLTEYVNSFIDPELENFEAPNRNKFSLIDLEKALNFALISEGILHNEDTYSYAVMLKVKMHSLVISQYKKFFDFEQYVTTEDYINMLFSKNSQRCQITNINLEDVDDWFAKFVTKVYVKMLFDFAKNMEARATEPFHIFIEEAHRYVQKDRDQELFGYNIFERVAKEGRKYGVLLNLISQRPVDISENVISQISNFIIFKLNHPRDLEYVKQMLPNISSEIVEKQKTLQPGTCIAFGTAFKIPLMIKMDPPNPAPSSNSCDVFKTWQS